jgi:hypothetical protein
MKDERQKADSTVALLHTQQLTNESVAAKAFAAHRDTKLHG